MSTILSTRIVYTHSRHRIFKVMLVFMLNNYFQNIIIYNKITSEHVYLIKLLYNNLTSLHHMVDWLCLELNNKNIKEISFVD